MDLLEVGNLGAEWATMETLLRTNGGRRGRDRKPNSVGGKGRGRARKPDFVACSARIVSRWVVLAWGTESYSGLAGNTCFVYLALRTSALGLGQTIRLGKRNTLCCKSGLEIYFYLVLWFFIFYLLFIIFCVKFLQNREVMATSLDLCCWPGRVGRMMTRKWSVPLRVCRVCMGERCGVPWGMRLF